MPIRFTCTHCGQKLSVGSHKAGQKANCPRCKEVVRVPGEVSKPSKALAQSMLVMTGDSEHPPAEAPDPHPQPEHAEEPFAPPVVSDHFVTESDPPFESSELVFDTSTPAKDDGGDPGVIQRTDYELVSFPRYVLYAQAGVIAGVAVVCFTLGALMGAAFFRGSGQVAAKPCTVRGFVQVNDGATIKGDAGAVVIALPHNVEKVVGERSPVEGLRPTDSTPEPTNRGLLLLRENGGSFAKADKDGKYQLRLPNQGKYFLFVISKAKTAPLGEVDALHMRKIATFFENATELIGTQKCQVFSEERFLADRDKFDVTFE